MLPSPVTSTPFSVKDILNLEQQQDPHYGAQLPHHLEHHFHPAACLLAAADGARFSDGEEEEEEEKLSYLSPMAAPGSQADARISADSYVHAVLRGSCEAPGPGEELDPAAREPSEYRCAPRHRPAGTGPLSTSALRPQPVEHRPAKPRSPPPPPRPLVVSSRDWHVAGLPPPSAARSLPPREAPPQEWPPQEWRPQSADPELRPDQARAPQFR